ncbi:sensor histidine kinase [Candidatus Velamenicoccus archaeovorus]|uniref:histidine kinase n=2 Tax=Velamenicoccus archaeovorus TaxID=1930593 RepID=A0A410P3Y0_VELA1|nr:ATP-binding protein [Candidatus Velamenicoccus archaeovorus]QAT16830.1 sensor histidine kinase [Candidatus Velamenicoccus archaeovorus]
MFSINWFFISSLVLTLAELFLILILLKYNNVNFHKMWLFFNFSVFIWAVGSTISSFLNFFSYEKIALLSWKIGDCGVSFISVFLLHAILLLIGRRNYLILILSYTQAIICSIVLLTTNLILGDYFENHLGVLIPFSGKYYFLWYALWTIIVTYAHFCLITFYWQDQNKRKDIRLLIILTILGCSSGAINFFYMYNPPFFQFANLGIVAYCLIFTYAVFRHKMFGIEIIYKKGLLYSILIAILSAIYLLLIIIIESLFRGIIGYQSFLLSLFSAFLMALLFNPLRQKIQTFVDKIFLGKSPEEIAKENELLKQELERSERLKAASALALGLAHEIKNPLTTLKTFSEFLPKKFKEEDFVTKFSKIIPAEVDRINNIVHKLLDFSKPTPPILKSVNICGIVRETLELMSNDFLKRKITLIEECTDHNLMVAVDAAQIKQVFFNVILNALDSMPRGGKIHIATKVKNTKQIEIILKDEGCGIPKKDMKNIFNPFFTTKDEGTGLGLAISHQIIKNNKGEIEVESELNTGTTVVIRLLRA